MCVILAQHRVLYYWKRGHDENDMLYEQLLCESQQQFSWLQTHVKPTNSIPPRDPARFRLVQGVHVFLMTRYN